MRYRTSRRCRLLAVSSYVSMAKVLCKSQVKVKVKVKGAKCQACQVRQCFQYCHPYHNGVGLSQHDIAAEAGSVEDMVAVRAHKLSWQQLF